MTVKQHREEGLKYELVISSTRAYWYRTFIYGIVIGWTVAVLFGFFIPWNGILDMVLAVAAAAAGGVFCSMATNWIWFRLALWRGWIRKIEPCSGESSARVSEAQEQQRRRTMSE